MKKVFDMFRLDGKVALVTGGGQGLGYDTACAFAEAGATVVISSRDASKIQGVVEQIARDYGVKVYAVEFDQKNYDEVERAIDGIVAKEGRLDILVNNAGGGSGKSEGNLLKRDPAHIKEMIDVNLTGMLFCSKAAARHMVEAGSGKIINLGSIAGVVGRDRSMYAKANKMMQPVDYAAAKGGVIGATRDLAGMLSPLGVCVNCISPGGFDKGELSPEFVSLYSDETPLGRMGKIGEDIKGTALLLASDAGAYITGQNIVVDGGFSIWK